MISLSNLFFQLVYTLMPLIEFQTRDQLDQPTLFRGSEKKKKEELHVNYLSKKSA